MTHIYMKAIPEIMTKPHIKRDGSKIELVSPDFVYCLDISNGLRADHVTNSITGRRLDLGNELELDIDLDAAQERIWITGWRIKCSNRERCDPDREPGFVEGLHRPQLHDDDWQESLTPVPEFIHTNPDVEDHYYWARTHVFIPKHAASRDLTLRLGGLGLYDFSYMRIFINGKQVGERHANSRWNRPGSFSIGPGSQAHEHLRFGQDNIIAVQATGYRARTERMEEIDPGRTRHLPLKGQWPGQFEQYLVVGEDRFSPLMEVVDVKETGSDSQGEVVFQLSSPDSQIEAEVTYRWCSTEPVLHRYASISNGGQERVTILKVRLGTYLTDIQVSEGEQGFPAYLGNEMFLALAHPSGWVRGEQGTVSLQQYPGRELHPGNSFQCMEAVLGFAPVEGARQCFLSHVRGRCRRVARGHDSLYAIFEPFGARETEEFEETEDFILKNLEKVAQGQREAGCDFDIYSIDFWVDWQGDLERFDPERFPHGFKKIGSRLEEMGISPGLWIDSSKGSWTIGGNPVVGPAWTHSGDYQPKIKTLCRAAEPVKTMYSEAFRHHIKENGVRLLKFDNLYPICYNPNHHHLPGIYSTEAIQDSVIGTLRDLDSECPDVFLMLYWGHRSPWWLLYADTIFEPGLAIEAASPSPSPAPYAKDSVTVGLDQAQWWCRDVPPIGKDSLGIWLSSWSWNSSIGKERWQEGFIMDMCRGSLLAQPWSDEAWLSPPERQRMAEFIQLLRDNQGCFSNPRPVLGNPWNQDPYGYCCTDGERAFVAVNNPTWEDAEVELQLNSKCGLDGSVTYELYRWYPDQARLRGRYRELSMAMRPFQVVLLEAVPSGDEPSLNLDFQAKKMRDHFEVPSLHLDLSFGDADEIREPPSPKKQEDSSSGLTKRTTRVLCTVPASKVPRLLVVSVQLSMGRISPMIRNLGMHFAARGLMDGAEVDVHPVIHERTYPSCWQAWRLDLEPCTKSRELELVVVAVIPEDLEMTWEGHLIVHDQ